MSEKSPLFISAMELLGHAVELLETDDDRKNKFIILHLSNAVELLLKDMVIDKGQSIYESNNKNTIVIWRAFSILESHGVTIKQRPKIEMLIDDRNAIQHKFGFPNRESVLYYMDFVIELFRTSMRDHYTIEFDEIVEEYFSETGMKLIGLANADEFTKVDEISKYDMLSAISTAYSLLETKVHDLLDHDQPSRPIMIWHDPRLYPLLNLLEPSVLEHKRPREYFDTIRHLRNLSVHRQHNDLEENIEYLKLGLSKIRKLYRALSEIPEDEIAKVVKGL